MCTVVSHGISEGTAVSQSWQKPMGHRRAKPSGVRQTPDGLLHLLPPPTYFLRARQQRPRALVLLHGHLDPRALA